VRRYLSTQASLKTEMVVLVLLIIMMLCQQRIVETGRLMQQLDLLLRSLKGSIFRVLLPSRTSKDVTSVCDEL